MASSWSCSISGRKATKARDWSIPVVNHTWLEDCFIRWKTLSVGLEKYVAFPPGLDFSNHLGERSIQREVILEGLLDLIAEIALSQGKITSVRKILDHHGGPQTPLPSQSSAPTSLPSLTITPASTTPPASPLSPLTSETSEEDVLSPTKRKSAPITTGSFGGSPSSGPPRQKSPSKSRATTPLPGFGSVVMPPSTRRTPRRSAANKAIQRLREEVMPDVVSFEKEMRRGQVRVANFSPKSEMTKTRLLAKHLSKCKKRLSMQPATALGDVGSSDEHDHECRRTEKRRRLSRMNSHHDRFEDSDDDGRTDIAGKSSQGSAAEIPSSKRGGAGKGPEVKEGDSQSGQVDSFHSFSPWWRGLMI